MSNRTEDFGANFMKWATSAKNQSKDGKCKVGACIVSQDDEIISLGYNQMPKNDNELFPFWENKEEKLQYVCHAELNAIVNSGRNDFSGCRMYVTRMPCDDCAKLIIQYKIKEVIYKEMKGKSVPACTEKMFESLESEGFVLRTEDLVGANFMKWATSAKNQSKDGKCKVGACIVSQDDEIISLGYNQMPKNDNELFPFWENKEEKLQYVCHAELNAIVNSGRNDFSGCRMYVTRMPCDDCAKLIIQYKIKEVIYKEMKGKSVPACTEKMFESLESEGFVLRKFENSTQSENRNKSPSKEKIERQNSDSDDCSLSLPNDPKKRKM